MNNFNEFVKLWQGQTKKVKVKKEYSHLLFLIVYPDKLEWNFSVEKQCQTTTFMVSGGPTGASTGHDVQFCYRSEVNDLLKKCSHSHVMIVAVGAVFDMVNTCATYDSRLISSISLRASNAFPEIIVFFTLPIISPFSIL